MTSLRSGACLIAMCLLFGVVAGYSIAWMIADRGVVGPEKVMSDMVEVEASSPVPLSWWPEGSPVNSLRTSQRGTVYVCDVPSGTGMRSQLFRLKSRKPR